LINIAGAAFNPVPFNNVAFKFPSARRANSTPPGKKMEVQSFPLHPIGDTPATKLDAPRMLKVLAEK
jgi:hypothetical protein